MLTSVAMGITLLANWERATNKVVGWAYESGLIREFARATEDETLIVVVAFDGSGGEVRAETHHEVAEGIRRTVASGTQVVPIRVEIDSRPLARADPADARSRGAHHNASVMVWGRESGVRLTVHVLNLRSSSNAQDLVSIDELRHTRIADPSAYARFVTQELPTHLALLSSYAVAQGYRAQGAYRDALRLLESATESLAPGLATADGAASAYFWLGWLRYLLDSEPRDVVRAYDQVILLQPENASAYNNRGGAHYRAGSYEAALGDFNRAVALEPSKQHLMSRGLAHAQLEALDAAIADYDRALELDTDYASALQARGLAFQRKGEFERASSDFYTAKAIRGDHARAYHDSALTFMELSQFERAIDELTEGIRLNPEWSDLFFHRGQARRMADDVQGAIADLSYAILLKADVPIYYHHRGVAYIARAQYLRAIDDFSRALELKPDSVDYLRHRAAAYRARGDVEEAAADTARADGLDQKRE